MLAPLFESRPSPFETRRTISPGVDRVARDHQVLAVALVPAEGRDAVVVAVEDARLAGRGHRRQDRLPARQLVAAVADPAGHRVDGAGPDAAGEDRMGEAVDLDDDEAGLVGRRRRPLEEQVLDRAGRRRSRRCRSPRIAVRTVLMMAYTNEPTSAVRKPPTWTPGTMFAATRKTSTWRTSTAIPVRISERGATRASTTGRTTALSSAITMTTIDAVEEPVDGDARAGARRSPGTRSAETTRVMSRRLSERPPPAAPLPQHPELCRVDRREVHRDPFPSCRPDGSNRRIPAQHRPDRVRPQPTAGSRRRCAPRAM